MPSGQRGARAASDPTPAIATRVSAAPRRLRPGWLNLAVVTVAVPAIFCTVALPAYAASRPVDATSTSTAASAKLDALKQSGAQAEPVDSTALSVAAREDYSATSAAELQRAQLKAAMVARAATYSGPSVRQLLENPPYPNFSLSSVVQVAERYQGVPYVYGGSTPAGFDCSGFVMYVYAQFGVSLPHSSRIQGQLPRIAPDAAQPGDIIVFGGGSHDGIYLGGNMMIHAPYPGRTVSIQAIYSTDHYFVRAGI